MPDTNSDLLMVLREQFAYDSFRPGQEQIIRALLAGRDVLALLPTGAGKSLVFQLTAQLLPGITLVVSPLLALMKDQIESVEERGLEAEAISSAQSKGEVAEALDEVQYGETKLLYVTPERFDDEAFVAEMQSTRVSLLVVDEAHCVSEWGHSFRPAYLALGQAASRLGQPAILALTATATPWVRRDIIERLGMREPEVVIYGSNRPNLFFEVLRVEDEREDRSLLEQLLTGEADRYPAPLPEYLTELMRGSGIIYTATTRAARETAGWLRRWGIAADYYHGQRRKTDRERVQEAFMRGETRVIVATNAFGLGIDKPDIRFVIHRDIPGSIESYYQEAGRAGRDGQPARCTIIYRPGDVSRAAFLAAGGRLTRAEVEQAHAGLVKTGAGTRPELAEATGLSRGDLTRLIEILKAEGIVAERRGRIRLLRPDFDPRQVPLEEEERRRAHERSRLEMLRGYAETNDCRRRFLLNYLGEEYEASACGWCDNDVLGVSAETQRPGAAPGAAASFSLGDLVEHATWGAGAVQRVTDDTVTVLFETAGYKTLATELVQERGLLHRRAEGASDQPAADQG